MSDATPDRVPEPVLMCWSGGKDSTMALAAALRDPALRVEALLTTITDEYERISMHGVRRVLLLAQAASLGLPLEEVRITRNASNDSYDRAMRAVLERYRAKGVERVIFGDLFLEDIRQYREERLAQIGMRGLYPLWGLDTRKLAYRVIDEGYRAVLTCVDPKHLGPEFCGRDFDWRLMADFPAHVDPCGERGEFHTFVHDGPIFKHPIEIVRGEVVNRDGFLFCDFRPAQSAPAK